MSLKFIVSVQILPHFTELALLILNMGESKEDCGKRKNKRTEVSPHLL